MRKNQPIKQKYRTANKKVQSNQWQRKVIDLPREIISHLNRELNKKRGDSRPHAYTVKRLLEKIIIENYKNVSI